MDWQNPIPFSYEKKDGKWHAPAFRLKITNSGMTKLWFSLVYFGKDFSISNNLLPMHSLDRTESVWASEIYKGQEYQTIPLSIPEDCLLYTSPSPRDATLSRMPSSA